MICSGKFIEVEPCEIISDNVLVIFIAATITDCWVKCKHTNNCETIATETAESGEITNSKKQIRSRVTYLRVMELQKSIVL